MFYPLFYILFISFALIIGGFLAYLFYRTEETKSSIFIGLIAGFALIVFISGPLIYLAPAKTTWHTLYPNAQIAKATIKTDYETYHLPKDNIPKSINNSGAISIADHKQTASRNLEKIIVNGNGDKVTSIDYGKTRQTLSLFGQKLYGDKKTTNRLRLNYKENNLDKLFKDWNYIQSFLYTD